MPGTSESDDLESIANLQKQQHFLVTLQDQKAHSAQRLYLTQQLVGNYGSYLWSSSIVLCHYLFSQKELLVNKYANNSDRKHQVLEIGCGVGLAGLFYASIVTNNINIALTDSRHVSGVLKLLKETVRLNSELWYPQFNKNILVHPFTWGQFHSDEIDTLLKDTFNNQLDLIIASDVFYDPKDFEDIIATLAYCFHQCQGPLKAIVAYQERSEMRNIDMLLKKWGLRGRCIPFQLENSDLVLTCRKLDINEENVTASILKEAMGKIVEGDGDEKDLARMMGIENVKILEILLEY